MVMVRADSRWRYLLNSTAAIVFSSLAAAASAGAQPPASPDPPAATATAPAAAAQERPAFFAEPRFIAKGLARAERFGREEGEGRPKNGFYPEMGEMITGAGWISVGPGFRHHVLNDRALVDMSAAVSWRTYKIAQARFELPYLADDRLAIGAKALWQDSTQVRYFGVGPESLSTGLSDYRIKSTDVAGYANWSATPTLELSASAGWLRAPTLQTSAGAFDRDLPDTLIVHAHESAASLVQQPSFLHGETAVTFDSRDQPGYPTRGSLYRVSGATYRDRSVGLHSFDRVELEAARFVPVAGDRGVIAVHWWTVLSHTGAGQEVPFYLLPSIGGHDSLRSYADYRFHDRHLMLANIESRWALFPHVDGAVFLDAGNVAARVGELDFARRSVGFGVRVHTATSTLARFDVAHGEDGWRVMMKLSDPLRLSRIARRTAAIPFVP